MRRESLATIFTARFLEAILCLVISGGLNVTSTNTVRSWFIKVGSPLSTNTPLLPADNEYSYRDGTSACVQIQPYVSIAQRFDRSTYLQLINREENTKRERERERERERLDGDTHTLRRDGGGGEDRQRVVVVGGGGWGACVNRA